MAAIEPELSKARERLGAVGRALDDLDVRPDAVRRALDDLGARASEAATHLATARKSAAEASEFRIAAETSAKDASTFRSAAETSAKDASAFRSAAETSAKDASNFRSAAERSSSEASAFRSTAEISAKEAAGAAEAAKRGRSGEEQPSVRSDALESRVRELEAGRVPPVLGLHEKRIEALESSEHKVELDLAEHGRRLASLENVSPETPPVSLDAVQSQVQDHEKRLCRLEHKPEVVPHSERELSEEGRRRIQEALARLSFDPGANDGVFGKKTRAAISRFQATLGVSLTRELTADQIGRLWHPPGSPTATDAC